MPRRDRPLTPREYQRISDIVVDGGHGSIVDKTVDVAKAARELGVTRAQVQRVLDSEHAAGNNVLFRFSTGLPGDVSGRADPSLVRDQLIAAYGPGRRGAAIDTRSAAKDLGVTQRTVERWIAAEGRQRATPKPASLQRLATRSRQSATTKRGRAAAVGRMRNTAQGKAKAKYGGKLTIDGHQGVVGDPKYQRFRAITLELKPDEVEKMWSAYEAGGQKAMMDWIIGRSNDYVQGWVVNRIDDLRWQD
ncbi:MAG TPA: terminal protein [Aldersonia sp.]